MLYLAIYLAGCYADALTDRPDLHPAVLYRRILGWVGPRTRTDDLPASANDQPVSDRQARHRAAG